jgi:large-conductance mechanosensitive channel
MKVMKRRLAFSLLIGLVVTVVSALMKNISIIGSVPEIRFVSEPLADVVYWGYVFPWLRQVVSTDAVKVVLWRNFIVDVLVWTAVAYIVFAAVNLPLQAARVRLKGRAKKKTRKSRK